MGIIHVLESDISNKIAAGEVVERPASVVKELIENSIDAGATTVTVEIRGGGVGYLRVTDNGRGMTADDAKICFLRHATSKIRSDEDLNAIYTLGFRGEALSSIGAVAQVSLYTKQKDGDGICVTCCGGEILSSEEAGIPDGTSVIAENLFYNTPARLKFLKKDSTEAGYVTDVVTRSVFAHPEISFRLTINGKEKLFSPGDNDLKNAVYTAYGRDYAKGMTEVNYEANGIAVKGLVGKGHISRPNRNYQSFFVNKRYIKSPLIFRAVEDAYKNQIMIGKFPVAVLNIEIDPRLVDINVHPTKLEVKFSNEKEVRNAIYYGVKNALYAIPDVPEIEHVDKGTGEVSLGKGRTQMSLEELARRLPTNLREYPNHSSGKGHGSGFSAAKGTYKYDRQKSNFNPAPRKPEFSESEIELDGLEDVILYGDSTPAANRGNFSTRSEFNDAAADIKSSDEPSESDFADKTRAAIKETYSESVYPERSYSERAYSEKPHSEKNLFDEGYFKIVGQIFDTYIIAEKDGKMLLMDQHAAHERLMYEELKRELAQKSIVSQMLIEAAVVKLTPREFAEFEDCADNLREVGFDCDVFGDDEVIIRGVPGELDADDAKELLIALITKSAEMKHELMTEKYERMLYTIACKAAVKANHRLSFDEMESLLKRVFALKNINTCPHGRPIIITMSKNELEKEFKRRT